MEEESILNQELRAEHSGTTQEEEFGMGIISIIFENITDEIRQKSNVVWINTIVWRGS